MRKVNPKDDSQPCLSFKATDMSKISCTDGARTPVQAKFAVHECTVSYIGVAAHYRRKLLDWRYVVPPNSIIAGY